MHKVETAGDIYEICSDGRLREVPQDGRQVRWYQYH